MLPMIQTKVAIIPISVANFRLTTASIASAHKTQSAVTATAKRAQQILFVAVVAILFSQSQPQHTNKTQLYGYTGVLISP
jgi:hypothetical protein